MDIGIIGAGMIGANLARLLVRAGHAVRLANSRGPETISALASETGATAVHATEAVQGVDLIIISIPQGAIEKLPAGLLADVPDEVPVIDTGNYYPVLRDQRIDAIEAGMVESLWVAQMLDRPVIKAFNSISFTSLARGGRASGEQGRIALPVAGDDARAKAVLIGLLDEIGFDGVDAGSLAESWRQQPGTPTYCTDLDRIGVARALALADRTFAPVRRDQFIERMLGTVPRPGPDELIKLGRSIYGAP